MHYGGGQHNKELAGEDTGQIMEREQVEAFPDPQPAKWRFRRLFLILGETKMRKRRFRKRKLIDKKQQLRFAFELVVYAMLFPMYFLILSLAAAITKSFMGEHTERMQPLYELLVFCTGHWWEFLVALAMVSGISILFSHKIFGPIHRFESALIQKTEKPTEPVNCRLRKKDYFQDFSQRLHEFLNASQTLAGSGDPEDSEVST